jgi:glycerate 2-kinase
VQGIKTNNFNGTSNSRLLMIIKNFESILANVESERERNARKTVLELLNVGINSVLPKNLIPQFVRRDGHKLIFKEIIFELTSNTNIFVIGAGKASGAMAEQLEHLLGSSITNGFVNIPEGTKNQYSTRKIQLNEASHPIPSRSGMHGAQKMVELIQSSQETDLIIVLLSGGASALLPLPVAIITLDQLQLLNKSLIKSGATIQEINTVRKHCSRIKGGLLSKIGYPATIVTLILSDVIGNPLDSIGSGPTVPDPTTFQQSIEILKKYSLWDTIPETIRHYLQKAQNGSVPETPKPNDEIFQKTHSVIIGDNRAACESIQQAANQRGFETLLYSSEITGEAREIGKKLLHLIKEERSKPISKSAKPLIIIGGGETTVTVRGEGMGGRCQEMGLSIIAEFENFSDTVFAAIGTDGIDGFTDATGIIIDERSANLMKNKELNWKNYLDENDSYNFFKQLGDSLIFTGPTGTNVNDLILIARF